jgi:L-malate glycosyltransferase
MKILFCVEFYYPSVGGAQEVVRQIAERMVSRGHEVGVATTRINSRKLPKHNGVTLFEFSVSGNRIRGLPGEVDRYQDFLRTGKFDVVIFYAAQQWTFDTAWPIMSRISARKIVIPCGYSNLYEVAYRKYFEELPEILRLMDAVVYHSQSYRDAAFGRLHQLENGVLIPNGADSSEFSVTADARFRRALSIDDSAVVLLTVGTMTGLKGHLELVRAFAKADFGDRKSALILNGNNPENGPRAATPRLFLALLQHGGVRYAFRQALKAVLRRVGIHVGTSTAIRNRANRVNREQGAVKQVIVADLARSELIQAYLNADLFVFASNVEYSPLVLFEACAAGLPFISVPVGNAAEIVEWTGGGEICEAPVDKRGYTRVSPDVLRRRIEALVRDPDKLSQLGKSGLAACQARYNWDTIAQRYEDLFNRLVAAQPAMTTTAV